MAAPFVVAAVLGLIGSSYLVARASSDLPPRSAAQLLADLQTTQVEHLSGTIIENAALGLPPLAVLAPASRGSAALALLSGSHTVRVWYGNQRQQRLEIVQTNGESDVFRDGSDVWQWDAGTRTAIHTTLPASSVDPVPGVQATASPSELARQALQALDPTTSVSTLDQRTVAGRSAYQLVLSPRDKRSRISSVRIAIDGQHRIPLSVQVFARGGGNSPVIDTAFTSIEFAAPSDASFFSFTPPKGATVQQQTTGNSTPAARTDPVRSVTTVGTGWTTVVKVSLPTNAQTQQALSLAATVLPKVSGTWGTGELFESKLLCVLITDTGTVFAGSVDPDVLYAAAD